MDASLLALVTCKIVKRERGRVSGSDFQSGGVTLIVSKFDQPTFYRQERGAYFPRLNRGGLIKERLRGGG